MSVTADFINENFKRISILKESANSIIELVTDGTGAVYVRKTINAVGLPYAKLAQICCPHLPKIYYTAEANGKTLVVEEFISGVNLAAELEQRKKFTAAQVRAIALQLCDALMMLHAQGILHRDIKPGNIIMHGGSVWLIDFGAAKIAGSGKERDTVILGTPGFAPPEQYGFTATDARSDIYALGKTMQALLGGSDGGSLQKIIAACTAFDPQNRIASAAELKNLLLKNNGSKKKAAAVVLAFIVACCGVYFTFMQGQNTTQPPGAEQKVEEKAPPQTAPQVKPSEVQTQQASPKTETAPPQKQSQSITAANNITLNANNLVFAINTNPLHEAARKQGAEHGFTLLQLPQNKYPVFTVQNNSEAAMQNPRLKIKFSGICVTGSNLTANAWGGRVLNWQLAKNAAGYAGEVTISLNGTIPAGDYFEFALTGAVANYYQTDGTPAAEVTLSGDNITTVTQNYNIKIN